MGTQREGGRGGLLYDNKLAKERKSRWWVLDCTGDKGTNRKGAPARVGRTISNAGKWETWNKVA